MINFYLTACGVLRQQSEPGLEAWQQYRGKFISTSCGVGFDALLKEELSTEPKWHPQPLKGISVSQSRVLWMEEVKAPP